MRVSVIGCGYLGAVHAAAMAAVGHEVVGVDIDPQKVALLTRAEAPFYEPGLPELLEEAHSTGRLSFGTEVSAIADADVHFVCVATPQRPDSYAADVRFVDAAFASVARAARPGSLVVGKSTVPVGTATRLAGMLAETGQLLAWNPEFLREGFAVRDTLEPDRLVYGVDNGEVSHPAVSVLDEVYQPILARQVPRLVMDYATAELVKVAANSFLATKISFINAMAEFCEVAGGDVTQLADAIGLDERIGRRFLNAGLGFGGGCLPKDIRAFIARAEELHVEPAVSFLREIDAINQRRRERMVDLTVEVVHDQPVAGARIAVLGAAFKPNSDDVRDSPALDVAERLAAMGAIVVVTDPEAIDNARRRSPHLSFARTVEEAAQDCDAVLLLTEWQQYRDLDPEKLGALVRHRRLVDGRNALDPTPWRNAHWSYRALGRH